MTFSPKLKLYFEIRNFIYHVKYIKMLLLENLFVFWLAENYWGKIIGGKEKLETNILR